jgi:CMP-N,N'-diacetyllegionaminic acid synthase
MINHQSCAIVTARKGSKGLVNKNILPFKDSNLTQFSIDFLIELNIFDKIILSTDIETLILKNNNKKEIHISTRPENLANDNTSQVEVVLDILEKEKLKGISYSHIFLFQPTSPFRKFSEIIKGFKELTSNKESNSIVGVSDPLSDPSDCLMESNCETMKFILPRELNSQRQEFKQTYFINGTFYGCKTDYFIKNKSFFDLKKSHLLLMSDYASIDIDKEIDYQIANLLIKKFKYNDI